MSTDHPSVADDAATRQTSTATARSNSFSQDSQTSGDSQTAAEFIRSQEALEADAREALPYSIDTCTNILGSLRQNVFACLTCNPRPEKQSDEWTPAGVCYACSVQCHGEHALVEIFQKRNFTCDCGTKRIPPTSPCSLRTNSETNTRGGVHSEEPAANNSYNQNFANRFCGCECDYDPFQQKGTMFQCLGLGTVETGGCGEDWYHPGCLVGMGPKWYEKMAAGRKPASEKNENGTLPPISEDQPNGTANDEAVVDDDDDDEPPMPPGFPDEEEFETFICYKCVEANPWIKSYAGSPGFLPAVMLDGATATATTTTIAPTPAPEEETGSKKRKAEDDVEEPAEPKRTRSESQDAAPGENKEGSEPLAPKREEEEERAKDITLGCKVPDLPTPPSGRFSLFLKDEDFRTKFCRCTTCYKHLDAHPQLLEEEEVYEPPLTDDGGSHHGGSTHGSGSLLERGESALRNVDRVRAIEGVMAYNHLKEKLKPFFQQFAQSGQAIGAEDIKSYFAKLRGDEDGIKKAGEAASKDGDGGSGQGDDHQRHEQSGC
ncbi:E3 ubiquitin-protein ligase UBR7 [Geosmithia morbida]|uniref:E3 ubiquitin-protein ligase UBR7 n=1 Tax=Geosmithia morbida TaxID=1094350 RepID=A0A9P4Z3L2_9HYPO|nr:E3 ubiquitin-protein ligase UBR7 [Geosmithia morbida]KAF4125999.1 E3 ubiquitin-protein ligase UBR7 [Geosmithia morbida]